MSNPSPRPRSKLRNVAMGALLLLVMGGGLTALISRAESTARADTPEPPAAIERHCELMGS